MSDSATHDALEGIAVIGMSGRFPGANTIGDFWRNLCDGVETIAFFSDEEIEAAGVNSAFLGMPNFVNSGRILDNIESFDASFFGYTPREAELMDPQHRLFLECAWEALENAGYDSDTYKGWIGVYGGVALNGYLLYNLFVNPEIRDFMETVGSVQGTTANDRDYVTTRVSYKLNLRGPSFNVQSACSTSLVAVHLACQSLLNYQCDMALAGGASVRVPHKAGYLYQEGGMFSPDGRCRTFDARAQGTIFGSGVGMVVLKRLEDAVKDGDQLYAVIKGSAINNDGSLKVGFTAPAVEGQASVIEVAQGVAGIDPETIGYIEAHGTATPLGDPIEVAALTRVFRASTQKKHFCAIGSVKTNIGHASAAAGVAGLIKTVLALKHGLIPPSLNFEQPNPKIDFASSPFYVNTRLAEWKPNGTPRRAGVSSFGVGGTNAHVVLEEAPPIAPSGPSRPWQLLVLSARTSTALETAATNLVEHLKQNPALDLADVAYTLQVGRRSFSHRRALICRDLADAVSALEARDPKRVVSSFHEQRDRQVVFMFSGQGAQYPNMGRELYETEPIFREVVDHCAELLLPHLGLDVREVLYPEEQRTKNEEQNREHHPEEPRTKNQEPGIDQRPTTTDHRPTSDSARPFTPSPLHPFTPSPLHSLPNTQHPTPNTLDQTWLTQPALFVIEYALAQMWMAWGIEPQAMIGHSVGEYVAACLAGVFALEDALALVAARGRLMQQLPSGAMLAIALPEQEVQALLGEQLSLAAVNGPSRCVVAGPTAAVDELERRMAEMGVDCRRLHTSHAFHSRMMEPVLDLFTKQVRRVALKAPTIPYVSNLTGTWISIEDAIDPQYWTRHLRRTVRFGDGLHELQREPNRILLEVGPGRTLGALARQHPDKSPEHIVLSSLRHPQDEQADGAFLLNTLGQIWLAGIAVDWPALYADERRRRLPLPTYPFERQRFWINPPKPEDTTKPRSGVLRKKAGIADWFYIPAWKRSLPPVREPGDLDGDAACWLVFSDACGLGEQLAQRLEQAGRQVVTVTPGTRFSRLGERAYTLNPQQPDDYDALLKELHESHTLPWTIAHLWSVTPDDQLRSSDERFEQAQVLGFYSLLFLAQALGRQNIADPVQLEIVSNNMQQVTGRETLRPEKATLLGPCKVIPAEYPNIICRSIDITLAEQGAHETEELIDLLIAEIVARSSDPVVACRGYDRWVQSYEAVRLGQAIEGRTRVREEGVYLITGGMGGIGLALAEELAQSARARLALVGRSAFPDRAEWDEWLATHTDAISSKIRTLRRLEALGAQVLVVGADVADEAQMRAAVARVQERFGAIHGVIHAAGIVGGGLIQLKTPEMAARVLAPKVQALRVLETVLEDTQLDLLVLCSSTIAITGGIGQVDYCAANSFLDAYAHYNTSRRGVFSVSINWDAWDEVGMAVNVAAAYGLREAPPAAHPRQLAHPLLDRRIQDAPDQQIYRTELDVAQHWILSEHKIAGVPAVPGTAYLELARAAFEQHAGAGPVELREVFFLTPLLMGMDERKEVHTILQGQGDVVEFRILSRPLSKGGEEPQWQEHVRGKVGRPDARAPKRYAIADILEKCGVREITLTAEAFAQAEKLVSWGPRWRSLERVHVGVNEGVGLLELPDEFAADLREFGLHPALLDVATAFGNGLAAEEGSYLPLSYGKLAVSGSLQKKIYSYARYKKDETAARKETISFDITIMDEQGQELVEIEDFTMKRVNESAGRVRETTRTAQRAAGIHTGEGVDAFKRILSRNRQPQVVVSTRDLYTLIERANTLKQARILEEIDRAQQFKPSHPRPAMQTEYAAPRNELEQRLAAIWQQTLGTDQVGIHDNFFELGGDSVLVIQVIARAGEAGIQLTPAQLFQHQTIADLAGVLNPAQAGQGSSAGVVPLTPIQRWFFAQDVPDPSRWSQALLLEAPAALDPALLEQAIRHVLARHDALRMRFVREESDWRQIAAPEDRALFSRKDLSAAPGAQREAAVAALIDEVRAGLGLAEGTLASAVLLDFGPGAPSQLLLVIHHLAIDPASWRIVLEDLWTAYEQLKQGRAVTLPPGTIAFTQWAERLVEHARSRIVQRERSYWLAAPRAQVAPLPLDHGADGRADGAQAVRTLTTALGTEDTRALIEEVPRAYNTFPDEVLLTALVEAFARWTGERTLLVDLEDDAREGVFDDLSLSRTVGCFTTVFPLRLGLSESDEPGDALKAVKEQRRGIPQRGIGYELLRYPSGDAEVAAQLQAMPRAEVHFSYHGRADRALPEESPLRLVREDHGPTHGPQYLLAIDAEIAGDQLRVEWAYREHMHRRATVERLAGDFMLALQSLIDHCLSPEVGGYTPSDFPAANLSQEKLDSFLTSIRRRSR